MTIPATGRIERLATGRQIVIERTFKAPIGDVWASIVDPERMNRWIGTWTGTPGTGKRVQFVMSAEGSTEPEDVEILACDAPRFLDVQTYQGEGSWRLAVRLSEADGVTTVVFTQQLEDEGDPSSYGVGWEYYMDRLGAVLGGAEFASWDDYYPSQMDHWQAEDAASRAE